MKKYIQNVIEKFIREYEQNTVTKWGIPLLGFASAEKVAETVPHIMEEHGLPTDAMDNPSIVIAYFIPFKQEMAATNSIGEIASEEWAIAYEETNTLIGKINEHLTSVLKEKECNVAVHPAAGSFDREELVSKWSHRHIAYLAGLGTFGINNMLITEHGCCGRYGTIITDLKVESDEPLGHELCGYKRDGSCGACMGACPSGALTPDGFDRHKCYLVCMRNAALYTEFGNSYDSGEKVGSEVCGKCIAGMPCAFL